MATYRRKLLDENGDTIIPAMTGDEAGWVKTGDIADGAVTTDKIAEGAIGTSRLSPDTVRRFVHTTSYAGVSIPANANLNSLAYCQVNHFFCNSGTTAATLTNCPTNTAFWMDVYHLNSAIDVTTGTYWAYLVRKLTVISGDEWEQAVSSNGEGVYSYGSWKHLVSEETIPKENYLTPSSGYSFTDVNSVFKTGKLMTVNICLKKDSGNFGTGSLVIGTVNSAYRPKVQLNTGAFYTTDTWDSPGVGYCYIGSNGNISVKSHVTNANIVKINVSYPTA